MANPSLRQLDIFAQMVAAGGISRCARDLGLPVEEIAQDITSLEMRLGYRLFEDLPERKRLTPAGHKTAEAMTLLSQDQQESWSACACTPVDRPRCSRSRLRPFPGGTRRFRGGE
jgi:DNA-binding transcriptional LysR family regulator